MSDASLPWRGPGGGRPDLPLPPDDALPLRRGGVWRKRWRYVGAFGDELLVCAARVNVGPLGQTFWIVCVRGEHRTCEGTRLLVPGARGDVWTEGRDGTGQILHAPDEGSVVRIESKHPEAGDVRAFLRFGGGRWVEAVCPTEDGQYVWTRKRVDVPVECDVRLGAHRLVAKARGVEDESAGYHPRHTVWSWSAGVGTTADGRSLGWNLVSGINDPPELSERAIWLDGDPSEPGPVEFEGLDAIRFPGGARLTFSGECERHREERRFFVRYSYRQPLGTFSGTLPGGIQLTRGLGVMEHHDAEW